MVRLLAGLAVIILLGGGAPTTIEAQSPFQLDLVPIAVGVSPSAHQHKKIRLGLCAEQMVAGVLLSLPLREQIPPLRQSGDQRDRPHTTIILGGQQHPRVAWVRRQ